MSAPLLILGSVALDTIETERGKVVDSLGGSATHACLAAGYFVRPRLVGVVGDDFPDGYHRFLASRIDVSELQVLPGATFRWHGMHSLARGTTTSIRTELNTYQQFDPRLSADSARAPFVFLGNIAPELQLQVLEQLRAPRFVACDTMALWIETQADAVFDVMRRVDLLLVNEEEAAALAGMPGAAGRDEADALAAGRTLLAEGARRVVIKRGAEPALLITRDRVWRVPSCPDVDVMDPTGAGDNFAGATLGLLAAQDGPIDDETLAAAMRVGAAAAAYNIELFGTLVHRYLTRRHLLVRQPEPPQPLERPR